MRYTEYHAGKAVIKDKNLLSEAMEKLAKFEDMEECGQWIDDVELAEIAIALESLKWIPCSERLPKKGESVLCYAKTRDGGYEVMRVGACHKGSWFFQDGGSERLCFPGNYVAVAWMPLPEPYKEGEDE